MGYYADIKNNKLEIYQVIHGDLYRIAGNKNSRAENGYKIMPPSFVVLEFEHRALYLLGRHFTT
jgi:hypothetical protein